jgi:NOL1/NOP2/sun family putative RNA methylase
MKNPPGKMEIPPLPGGFVESLAPLLKEEAQAFLHSYEQPYHRGLRLNPMKIPAGGVEALVPGILEAVPWEPMGRYLALDSTAGLHPIHEAGAYYLQEPSAMAAVAALDPRPGEWILDLCAAPGGKSSQIAARMQGRGLLVSNEIVPSRAQILSRNLERMGVINALVTCENPAKLMAKWPGCFDRVLADAPCSGEGMFRRHPEARLEWSVQAPEACARRQGEVLRSAARMVRPGGILCYSTCTFNDLENEGVVRDFLKENSEFRLMPFMLSMEFSGELSGENGMLRLWPHKVSGEGHFVALLQRRGEGGRDAGEAALPPPSREALAAYREFCKAALGGSGPEPGGMFAGRLILAPGMPDVSGLKVLRAGLHLGEAKGKHFLPDHAWAMASKPPEGAQSLPVTFSEAEAYLRGEAIPAPEGVSGWVLMRFAGLALGWGKVSEGRVQNHYPKGLRKG